MRQGTKTNPNKKRYYTLTADTREDVNKLRGSEIVRRIREQGVNSIEKQMKAQREGESVRYPNGMKLRLPIDQAEGAVKYMERNVPGGPPAVRPSVQIPGYFKTMPDGTRRLVREGEEGY